MQPSLLLLSAIAAIASAQQITPWPRANKELPRGTNPVAGTVDPVCAAAVASCCQSGTNCDQAQPFFDTIFVTGFGMLNCTGINIVFSDSVDPDSQYCATLHGPLLSAPSS